MNAARLLDRLGVRYELREYEVDPEALDAETVAAKIRLPAEQVFKTLVARGDRNGICLAVVPANAELDEKALARLAGDRKTELVPLKDVQPLTGYIRGGVTALAGKRDYPVFVDETVELFNVIPYRLEFAARRSCWRPQITLRPCMVLWEPSRGVRRELWGVPRINLSQHHAHNTSGRGADRKADSDFACPPAHANISDRAKDDRRFPFRRQ